MAVKEPSRADFGLNRTEDERYEKVCNHLREFDEARKGVTHSIAMIFGVLCTIYGGFLLYRNEPSLGLVLYSMFGVAFYAFPIGYFSVRMVSYVLSFPLKFILPSNRYIRLNYRFFKDYFEKVSKYQKAESEYKFWWTRTQSDHWLNLDGHSFERELAELYRKHGYVVVRSPLSNDHGVDITLYKNGKTIVVQCKAHKKPVGPSVARELYGTLVAIGANEAILASTNGFTKGVYEFSAGKKINLVSLDEILAMQRQL